MRTASLSLTVSSIILSSRPVSSFSESEPDNCQDRRRGRGRTPGPGPRSTGNRDRLQSILPVCVYMPVSVCINSHHNVHRKWLSVPVGVHMCMYDNSIAYISMYLLGICLFLIHMLTTCQKLLSMNVPVHMCMYGTHWQKVLRLGST